MVRMVLRVGKGGDNPELTLLLLLLALMSCSRKTSQSFSAEASSTTIWRLSSESLKMMYLCFFASLRSLNAVMHSCETVALHRPAALVFSSRPLPEQFRAEPFTVEAHGRRQISKGLMLGRDCAGSVSTNIDRNLSTDLHLRDGLVDRTTKRIVDVQGL
ncbi:hypothetical protein GGR54DRAFT_209170 [Hypoxylon sp. NC1633]|nr:hypothetical protein GGR54DRAFT_209170 [Hypoxylon sp. NC1633]